MSDVLLEHKPGSLVVVDKIKTARALGVGCVTIDGVDHYYTTKGGTYFLAGFTDLIEAAILNDFWTDGAYTPPATLYLALSTTTPTDAATNFTEPSTGSYARVGTAAADMNAANPVGGGASTKANGTAKSFPTATGDWSSGANMTHYGLFDASTAGALVWFAALTTGKPVLNGDTASFAIGSLIAKLGDPGDAY